jgi:hypothetical protein
MLTALFLLACAPDVSKDTSATVEPSPVPWSGGQLPTTEDVPAQRGWQARRGIIHLHSPWSHDACDGNPLPDGSPDLDCLADLRLGLCETAMDFAYLTDHPTHAADQPYKALFHSQAEDTPVREDGQQIGNRIPCESGHEVLWMPGIENNLMPVGLEAHAGDSPEERHTHYELTDADTIDTLKDAGGIVLVAHTEGKELSYLSELVDAGLQGLELFNLHAAFDPTKREEDLGLDGLGWLSEISPFSTAAGTGEPDLFFLAVLQEQTVSLERWDSLSASGPMIGVAGTDAHQNTLPIDFRDGERGDSYRRMMRWFSNNLLVDSSVSSLTPAHTDEALTAGRAYVAFEILGTPAGFDYRLQAQSGEVYEMGSTAPGGTLHIACPTLSQASPTNLELPDISVTVFKDGLSWHSGCGSVATDGPGVYRVRVDIIPWHLRDFLGENPDTWLHSYPWVYSNPIRVTSAPGGT